MGSPCQASLSHHAELMLPFDYVSLYRAVHQYFAVLFVSSLITSAAFA